MYFGYNDSDKVNYVGITKQNLDRRLAQHQRAGKEIDYLIEQHGGLTRHQAKALEQYYINQHGGARLHGGKKLLNIIDSIGVRNKYREQALDQAEAYVKGEV